MRAHLHRERRLPTRVSTACDRCRRRKQRCDDQRPCSNCMSADLVCTSMWAAAIKRPRPLGRLSNTGSAPESHVHGEHVSSMEEDLSTEMSACSDNENIQNDPHRRRDPTAGQETLSNPSHIAQTSPKSISSSNPRTRHVRTISELEEGGSTVAITRKIFDNESPHAYRERETFAIPGADIPKSQEQHQRKSIPEVLGVDLPPHFACYALIETYFQSVHWFSLVVYEPKFRARFKDIMDSGGANVSDRGFLLLLAMVLIMGSWYTSEDNLYNQNNVPYNITTMRSKYLTLIRSRFLDLMDEDSLEFVQVSTLLGSFYLYHSRPRASFSILGAATKTAQAMKLHRESSEADSFDDKEERKRVWWTIYTWDRFAAIIYGRPLGVNDRDCNVSMPSIFDENVTFDPLLGPSRVCLSAYQVQLNVIYQIASPVLENLYTIRHSQDTNQRSELSITIAEVDQALKKWKDDLPSFLSFGVIEDISTSSTVQEKAHSLQAFSLQLTYDNLVMVINRPLLADGVSLLSSTVPDASENWSESAHERMANTQGSAERRRVAFRRCLDSALSISRVQSKKNLVQLAQQTHLISFIGINLFTASVVLFICARSDILSNLAQEAKRGMSRILQLQKRLSIQASLSMQCSVILEDLVHLVLEKEKEALLSSDFVEEYNASSAHQTNQGFQNVPATMENPDLMHSGAMDSGAALNSGWSTEMANISYHNDYLRESLVSLQRVVHDNVLEPHAMSDDPASYQTASDMPVTENWRYQDHTAYSNNNADAGGRLEDLGQFWLWNL